jgi:hypothetical protein
MIEVRENWISKEGIEAILQLWDESGIETMLDGIYHYYGMDLIPHLQRMEAIIPQLKGGRFVKFRIQLTDETIHQVPKTHQHQNPYSFVLFLNEGFEGGELVFNHTTIKPKVGTMVYFTGEEGHRVENTIGKRYTLVGFLKNDIFETKPTII